MVSILTPEKLCQEVSAVLSDQCTIEKNCPNNIRVLKRQRELKDGDFVVPPGKDKLFSEEVIERCRTALSAVLNENGLQIKSVSQCKHFPLVITLDRESVFKTVITSVCHQGNSYGLKTKTEECVQGRLLINSSGLVCQGGDDQSELPLTTLRTIILLKHVRQLLRANGFDAACIGKNQPPQVKHLMRLFEMDCPGEEKCEKSKTELKKRVLSSKYRRKKDVWKQDNTPRSTKESTSCEMVLDNNVTPAVQDSDNINLELHEFILENPALRGYDKNINAINVINKGEATDVLKEVTSLESELEILHEVSKNTTSATTVLHLTSHSRGYFQQQVDLVWRLLSPDIAQINQVHLIHGAVHSISKSHKLSPEIFYSKIREEIRQSTVVKYGDQVQGEGWERNIDIVTRATVMFDFLTSNCKNTLKLSLPDTGAGDVSLKRSGTFVMYNAARIATLFTHFQKAVHEGQYPVLPPVEEIDFSLLNEQDEWTLLFNFIWPFPDIVSETVAGLVVPGKITADIQTHKVCTFLTSLSQHLSAYYSRIHILGESRSHLYPLMFARLYLLKAVHQIFINGLALLDIEPLTQL